MGVPPSEVLLSASPQVALRIQVLLRRARPHRGEWVLPAGPPAVWPPEVLPLVVPSIRESPPQVPQPLGLLASPPQVGQQQGKRQAVGPSPQRS